MNLSKWIVIFFFLFNSMIIHAQRLWDGEKNQIGIRAGGNYFDIRTDDLPINRGTSWTGGFNTRSDFNENFQWVYGITFFDFKSQVTGREKKEVLDVWEEVDFNMMGIQANFFGSYRVLGDYLSLEAGPVVQVNGEFKPRQDKDFYYIRGYDIQASDLQKVSTINFNFAVGITGGLENLRIWAQYQYGANNFFGKLNNEGIEGKDVSARDLNGHLSILAAGLAIYL